jgi:parallel beta-helix repeat protein
MKGVSMRDPFRPLAACLLAVFLVVLLAGVASAQQKESTTPESTNPESTNLESTAPVSSQQQGAQAEGLIVRPGESIQGAVDAAEPGDTIVVLGGVHRESVVIEKDGIALRGVNTLLKPPAEPAEGPCEGSGFCVFGDVNFETGEVSRYVNNVSISGFKMLDFPAFGIFAFGAQDARFVKNRAFNNGEYGIAAFTSTGTQITSNVTSGSDVAGIYVGDSPQADATVAGNETYGNLFGVFVRNALHGHIVGNAVHNNCIGLLFLAGAPGPAGEFGVSTNTVRKNTRSCPAAEEGFPAVSGVGVALLGATGVEISGNRIGGNVPSGRTAFRGGVVVVSSPIDQTPPTDNSVFGNVILNNRPDLFWDETGSGNTFVDNDCETSDPEDLCEG